jgi:acyl-CoA synthetase (AMP-forming)/AMP-acid ligase II
LLRAAADAGAIAAIGDARTVQLLAPLLRRVIPIEQLRAGPGPQAQTLYPNSEEAAAPGQSGPAWMGPGAGSKLRSGDLLLQSSGTTGLPKIVRRSGDSLDAVARGSAESVGFRPDDRVLMTVPLTHSYGLEHGVLAPIWAGSCVHLCRGLNLPVIVPELIAGGITLFPGVPSTFEMLAGVAEAGLTMPSLRTAYAAGAPLPRPVFDAFAERFGIRVAQLYGASEIGSVTFNPPGDDFDPASAGLPFNGVSIRILHPDTNAALPTGAEGQVAVRAASMFSGYLNAPADLIDGYFATGDLGRLDAAGRLFITGRIKLLIDVGGLKVNPLEVEAVLAEHPAVAACVVVPVQQSQTVFRLKAIIAPRHPAAPPAASDLRRFAQSRLAAYKVPRLFEVRDSLPRSATGKILRHLLEKA